MKLSKDQRSALNKVRRWTWDPSKPELAIGGLAGTGKTTIVGALQRQRWLADVSITYLAPTGKAAQALRRKGLPAQTIHSFMYKFAGWRFNDFKGVHDPSFKWREPDHDGGLIVVDEASMVSGRIADELRDSGARILWVGDHGQLPPIGADPGIMTSPDVRLEKVHRQAAGSPILRLAYHVRAGLDPCSFEADEDDDALEVARMSSANAQQLAAALIDEEFQQVIVGMHRTRITINEAWRKVQGRKSDVPEEGERLVCLKNSATEGLMNGMTFMVDKVLSVKDGVVVADLTCLDNGLSYPLVRMWRRVFGCLYPELKDLPEDANAFDYGYAITCHKAQGSEWESVAVIEDFKRPSWSVERWRYTAYTRAKSRLCVLIGGVRR